MAEGSGGGCGRGRGGCGRSRSGCGWGGCWRGMRFLSPRRRRCGQDVGDVEVEVEVIELFCLRTVNLIHSLTDPRLLIKHSSIQTEELDVLDFV